MRPGCAAQHRIACAPGIAAGPRTFWRAASLSKIVTARTFLAAARLAGCGEAPEALPAEAILGWPLRHPAFPDRPVTVGQLASHTSGLTDDAGYLVPAGTALRDWLAAAGPGAWGPAPPGAAFAYCNLGAILLAACAELLGGARFDRLAQDLVLAPAGIAGGFNWSGIADRTDRVATFRRDAGRLVAQIDAQVAPDGVCGPDGAPIDLSDWRPGRNPAVFSPQGGLRLSLEGALRLAESLTAAEARPLWTGGPGGDPLFPAYGWGVQIIDRPAFHPRPLIGHFGNAYGFRGGAWKDRATGTAFAYALNGFAVGDDDDALTPAEAAIFAALARVDAPDPG